MIYDNLNILSLTFFFLVFSAIEFGIGLILLLECTRTHGLGYSIILMIAACITGYIVAIYFAAVTCGSKHHYHSSSTIITRETVRF